jgi:hypothetical protein
VHGGTNSVTTTIGDLWRIETRPGSTQLYWTFLAGTTTVVSELVRVVAADFSDSQNSPGYAGVRGVPAAANFPGSRFAHAMAVNANSDVVLFGVRRFAVAWNRSSSHVHRRRLDYF